ncbi:MAG TPA: YraN family protein [Flavilitoribacter sp.]|nr:YraN family protein [Flavilitoribacter sp.]HMQ85965.1 YraN family protein [Flavilitoribacter sp.]
MSKQAFRGKWGEGLAVDYLQRKEYKILAANWRHRRAEVDIVAEAPSGILVFVEVKTRSSTHFGLPEDFVTPAKQRLLVSAASAFMEAAGYDWEIRFDIISILRHSDQDYEIKHLEDVFWPV